jgi:hypothetical protein
MIGVLNLLEKYITNLISRNIYLNFENKLSTV